MKLTISLLAGGLSFSGFSALAQTQSTNAVVREFPLIAAEAVTTNFSTSLFPLYEVASLETGSLRLDAAEAKVALETPATAGLTRIETGPVVIEGSLTPAVKQGGFRSIANLFNPFAPKEYGGREMRRGGTTSRAFHDPVKSEPGLVLISVGSGENRTKSVSDD